MNETESEHRRILAQAKSIFQQKHCDYGSSWRVMRFPSLLDQLLIKCRRIRNIEDHNEQHVPDSIESEWYGIINYSIMALMQRASGPQDPDAELEEDLLETYDQHAAYARELMAKKNHDYGEVWRDMMPQSFTDLILAKLHRMRTMVRNKEQVSASEGINANLYDVINYAVFALIHLESSIQS